MADRGDVNMLWKKIFKPLFSCDVVISHLVQDMGQPPHTRNDQHPGTPNLTATRSLA